MSEQQNEERQMMAYYFLSLLLFSGFVFSYLLSGSITGHVLFFSSLLSYIFAVNYLFAKKFVGQQQSKSPICEVKNVGEDKSISVEAVTEVQEQPQIQTEVEMETGDKLFASEQEKEVVQEALAGDKKQ